MKVTSESLKTEIDVKRKKNESSMSGSFVVLRVFKRRYAI